jgi:hypothetical protein
MAVPAIPKPPRWTPGTNPRTVEDESVRITPEPRKIMCRPGGKEMCRSAGQDRAHEVLARHLYERDQLYVPDRDGVEGDMDAPGTRGHSVSMFVDRRLVERIDLCRLGHSSRRGDLLPPRRALRGYGREEHPGSLAGESAGDGATYGPSAP